MKCLRCGMPRKFLQEGSDEICINGFPTHKWKGKMSTNKKLAEGGKAYEKEFIAHELCREEIAQLKDLLLLKRKIIKRLKAELIKAKDSLCSCQRLYASAELKAQGFARKCDEFQAENSKMRETIQYALQEIGRPTMSYAPDVEAREQENIRIVVTGILQKSLEGK